MKLLKNLIKYSKHNSYVNVTKTFNLIECKMKLFIIKMY